ncbi:hypothetical protein D3C71_89720 [compost metagenome]
MNIENFEYLQKQLEKRGWEELNPQLAEHIAQGKESFDLYISQSPDPLTIDYELKFRKHAEHPFYYFNRINAALSEGDQVLAEASFRESWNLMPEEMYQILKYGNKVAVYKEGIKNEAGEPFNAWITVNADIPLTEEGLLNLNTYHDKYYKKYPFNLDYSLSKLPDDIKEQIKNDFADVIAHLKHGIPYPVNVDKAGTLEPSFLSVNAKVGRVDLFNANMEPLALAEKTEMKQSGNLSNGAEQQLAIDGEKKKPQQVRPNHFKNNKQSRGLSR